jgi:hypothetical protein
MQSIERIMARSTTPRQNWVVHQRRCLPTRQDHEPIRCWTRQLPRAVIMGDDENGNTADFGSSPQQNNVIPPQRKM